MVQSSLLMLMVWWWFTQRSVLVSRDVQRRWRSISMVYSTVSNHDICSSLFSRKFNIKQDWLELVVSWRLTTLCSSKVVCNNASPFVVNVVIQLEMIVLVLILLPQGLLPVLVYLPRPYEWCHRLWNEVATTSSLYRWWCSWCLSPFVINNIQQCHLWRGSTFTEFR